MARRKIEIRAIKDDRNRSVTFLKRKGHLFKRAHELSVLCSVDVAVFVFGSNKKLYEYSSKDMHELIHRYSFHGGPNEHKGPNDFNGGDDDDTDFEGTFLHGHEGSVEQRMIPPSFQGQPAFPYPWHLTPSASPPINVKGYTPQPAQYDPPPAPAPAQYQYSAVAHFPQIPPYIEEAGRSSGTPSYPPQVHIQHLPPQHVPHMSPPQLLHQHLDVSGAALRKHPQIQPHHIPSPPAQSLPPIDPPKSERIHGRPTQPGLNTSTIRRLPQGNQSGSIFTPVDNNHSTLDQHLDSFHADAQSKGKGSNQAQPFNVGAISELKASGSPPVPQRTNIGACFLKARGSISMLPTPPSRFNSPKIDGTLRPWLRVQIPDNASNADSSPRKTTTNSPQYTFSQPARRNRADAPSLSPSPSTSTIVSTGATGPPNPFARPPPQTHSTSMDIDTPLSALPSRFLNSEFLTSPSIFFPNWNFRGNDSNTLPSPLNFATPVAGSGPPFLRGDGDGFYAEMKLDQLSPKVIPTIAETTESRAEQNETSSEKFSGIKGPIDKPHILGKLPNFVDMADRLRYDTSLESLSPLVKEKLYSASKYSMDRVVDALQAANTHKLSTECSPYATQTTVCSDSIEFIIETHLTLLDYIKQNLSNERSEVSTLVTITGTAFYAYAITCLDYLKSTWPDTGEILLPILQEATQEVLHQPDSTAKISKEHDQLWALSIELCGDGSLKLRAKGSETFAVDITQQLCWLTATFSTPPPSEENIRYCAPRIELIRDSSSAQPNLKLEACFTELHASERNSCWLSLFSNAVIAHGFPIPERADGVGLEMSVELMAGIIGARHAATFNGGVVIKGFSSMFVPVMRTRDGIQWHYVANSDPDMQLSYEEGVKKCSNRLLDLDLASLTTARCFIGWNSLVEVRVGDETNSFENIEFSDAAEVKAALQIPGGSLGFQQFGLAQIDVTFSKRDGKCHFQRSSSYRRIVYAAERMFVALFDTGERRSYLVPASGLLLHILRHRLSSGLGGVPASKVKILSAESFTEQLLRNAKVRLTSEGDEPLFVDDVVSEIWSVLELLQAQSISAEKNSKLEIHATWQERLLGYEYKAVVEDWSPMPLKELEIHKTCGGWPRLIRDVNALVLLANGFGDLILPIGDQTGLCHQWKTLPRGKDYMAVPIKILLNLYSLAGCRESRIRITATNLALHGPATSLFKPCDTPKERQCSCDRLQQVVSISSFGNIYVPELVEGNGAVIIGESSSLLKRFTKRTMPKIVGIIGNHAKVVSEGEAFLSCNSDTSGSSIGSESSNFRRNTSSPTSSVADNNEVSSKNLDSMRTGSFNFRHRRKRGLSEISGSISTVPSFSAVDSPRLVKQPCLDKLSCRENLLADGSRS